MGAFTGRIVGLHVAPDVLPLLAVVRFCNTHQDK